MGRAERRELVSIIFFLICLIPPHVCSVATLQLSWTRWNARTISTTDRPTDQHLDIRHHACNGKHEKMGTNRRDTLHERFLRIWQYGPLTRGSGSGRHRLNHKQVVEGVRQRTSLVHERTIRAAVNNGPPAGKAHNSSQVLWSFQPMEQTPPLLDLAGHATLGLSRNSSQATTKHTTSFVCLCCIDHSPRLRLLEFGLYWRHRYWYSPLCLVLHRIEPGNLPDVIVENGSAPSAHAQARALSVLQFGHLHCETTCPHWISPLSYHPLSKSTLHVMRTVLLSTHGFSKKAHNSILLRMSYRFPHHS